VIGKPCWRGISRGPHRNGGRTFAVRSPCHYGPARAGSSATLYTALNEAQRRLDLTSPPPRTFHPHGASSKKTLVGSLAGNNRTSRPRDRGWVRPLRNRAVSLARFVEKASGEAGSGALSPAGRAPGLPHLEQTILHLVTGLDPGLGRARGYSILKKAVNSTDVICPPGRSAHVTWGGCRWNGRARAMAQSCVDRHRLISGAGAQEFKRPGWSAKTKRATGRWWEGLLAQRRCRKECWGAAALQMKGPHSFAARGAPSGGRQRQANLLLGRRQLSELALGCPSASPAPGDMWIKTHWGVFVALEGRAFISHLR